MKLFIGDTIKNYRKKLNITQERLAELLNISCQSISRWENNVCYPDIELIPVIADIFGISTDCLLGVNNLMEKKKIEAYLNDFQLSLSRGEIKNCINIARVSVAEYPNNYKLLYNLLYSLTVYCHNDAESSDTSSKRHQHDSEIVALAERIINNCNDNDICLQATARLAFHHCKMGRKQVGRSLYNSLPSMMLCKELRIHNALESDEKLEHTIDFIRKSYNMLSKALYDLATNESVSPERAIITFEKRFELDKIIYDNSFPNYTWDKANSHYEIAKAYMKINKYDIALDHLSIASDYAIDFDVRPDTKSFQTAILGKITKRKSDYGVSSTSSLSEIMKTQWLTSPEFDDIRDTDKFQKILCNLSRI